MAKLRPQAAAGGYAPDCYVTSDLVPNARPSPAMIFKNMIELDVWSPQSVVKVDDTTGGIKAGLYGGMWTVGIAKTGNYVGMTETQMDQADPDELEAKVARPGKFCEIQELTMSLIPLMIYLELLKKSTIDLLWECHHQLKKRMICL